MRALDAIAAQRGALFAWTPVALAIGVGSYFGLPAEPVAWQWAALGGVAAVLLVAVLMAGERAAPVLLALLLVVSGVLLGGARSHLVAAPVLKYRFYGAVEGRIVAIDRSQSDALRLTLDKVWLGRTPARKTPRRVRISLHGASNGAQDGTQGAFAPQDGTQGAFAPLPGQRVALTAHLSPPPAPSEPGGFDFQRHAWFDRLGAVGYTRSPVVLPGPATGEGGVGLWLYRVRLALSAAIRARMPGDDGAFAAAILTGDRSAMSHQTVLALRNSNLAHLLAISGLHMGLLTGFVFAALRYGMALVPPLALRVPVKKLAAVGALLAAVVYLLMSGGNVATQRAFVMVTVMLVAVLFDRRALTLRAVAVAALIVLLMQPESLTEPGFQMSFAATTALVAVFTMLRDWPETRWRPPRWTRPILAVVISSFVAGIATAPFSAAHFNQVAQYGLLANLLSVPLMGTVVIPAAVLAAALAPLGLAWLGLAIMRLGIAWILGVAHWVAGLDGATWPVVMPGASVLPMLSLGMLWLILWRGRARVIGVLPVVVALLIWSQTERPALLISENGGLIGVMTPVGRDLSKPGGDGFTARSWLENDGDAALQEVAFRRRGLTGDKGFQVADVAGQPFVQLTGRGWAKKLERACATGWVILPHKLDLPVPEGCVMLDQRKLAQTGAIAVYAGAGGPVLIGVKAHVGRRPWAR